MLVELQYLLSREVNLIDRTNTAILWNLMQVVVLSKWGFAEFRPINQTYNRDMALLKANTTFKCSVFKFLIFTGFYSEGRPVTVTETWSMTYRHLQFHATRRHIWKLILDHFSFYFIWEFNEFVSCLSTLINVSVCVFPVLMLYATRIRVLCISSAAFRA